MRHSALNKKLMLEWILSCHDEGRPMPSDQEIVDRFILSGPDAARTLLADLADAGHITLSYVGGRQIKVGRAASRPFKSATAAPTIKTAAGRRPPAPGSRLDMIRAVGEKLKSAQALKETVAQEAAQSSATRIAAMRLSTAAREKTPPGAVIPKSEIPERSEVETVEAQQEDRPHGQPAPASVDQGPRPACPPAQAAEETIAPVKASPQPVEARQPVSREVTPYHGRTTIIGKPVDVGPGPGERIATRSRKQVNIPLTNDLYETLSKRADERGIIASKLALEIVTEALTAPETVEAPPGKPRISVDTYRAWQADGRPFAEWLTAMIEIGVEECRRFRAGQEAKAA